MSKQKNSRIKSVLLYSMGTFAWLLAISLMINPKVDALSSFIQSYNSSVGMEQGMVVQLSSNKANSISPASQENIYKTFGVVVNSNDASVAFTNSSSSKQQVFVATGGHYNVLVSDQNGTIKQGDYLTVSPLEGVAMKNNNSEPIVIGQALSSFSGSSSNVIGTDVFKLSGGGTQTIHLGLIPVNISVGHNPQLISAQSSVPTYLQSFSQGIAGRVDSPWRIYMAAVVLVAIGIIVGSMLYSAVRNSIISIGRNPLSRKAITKGFIQVTLSALIIFISGVFGVYLLLKI